MPTVTLPKIKVRTGVVGARAVKEGELAHCRFEIEPGKPVYTLAPAQIARKWLEHGVTEMPRSVEPGFARAPKEEIGRLAAIRLRFGVQDTTNFLVPPEMAREWLATAQRFERLYHDYQKMMETGG